eukprot:2228929-Ditylum_brightwellii.AAC.1
MQDNNIHVNPNWWKHKPKPATVIINQLLVTYGMTQEVENVVEANCPDIAILNEKEKKALLIDVTIPMDINMIKAVAVGTQGTICQNMKDLLARVSSRANLDLIQKE